MIVRLIDGRELDFRHREGDVFWFVSWRDHYAVGKRSHEIEPMQMVFG